jgi:hypothetical protein
VSFHDDSKPLEFPESDAMLRRSFVVCLERRVSGDHVVSVGRVPYEVPRGHAGQKVQVYHQLLEDKILFCHEGRFVELHPVDLAGNALDRRAGSDRVLQEDEVHPPPRSAADMAFERDFSPIVGRDGGFADPRKDVP